MLPAPKPDIKKHILLGIVENTLENVATYKIYNK